MHLGIDFGAKLAGTTTVCFANDGQLYQLQSNKKQDADAWLRHLVEEQKPSAIFMDAPLSLPSVYKSFGADYHYRACDRAVGAMSPMFLGGLTARAMQLRARFPEIPFYEAYSAQHVRMLFAGAIGYKTDLAMFLEKLLRIQKELQEEDSTLSLISNQELVAIQIVWYRDSIFSDRVSDIYNRVYLSKMAEMDKLVVMD